MIGSTFKLAFPTFAILGTPVGFFAGAVVDSSSSSSSEVEKAVERGREVEEVVGFLR